jgi:hypothetical protein
MVKNNSRATLTDNERAIIKALLNDGWRNQDIQVLINTGRPASMNFGRIAEIKNDPMIQPASKQKVDLFRDKKLRFDHVTGLCPFDNERLVRAREAMILAVELFNTPRIAFKAGVFSMLTNVAWTYLLHQFYEDKGVALIDKDGWSLQLSKMLARMDCPLSEPCKKNLIALKEIRDLTEHLTVGPFDKKWLPLFQSNCLNFEKAITNIFGEKLTLGNDLGFALQFAKLSTSEIANLQAYDLPPHIAALDATLANNLTEDEADNLEYQFKVVYTLASASKSKAHFQFINPGSTEGLEIQNVLIKHKPSDELYPYRPTKVVKKVTELSGRAFSSDKHQKAWKFYKVRPKTGASTPAALKAEYCHYNMAHGDYTYSEDWIKFLVSECVQEERWKALCAFKP